MLALALGVVASLTVGSAGAAAAEIATAPAAGAFVFTCEADLPEWPSPGNTGNCDGGPVNAGVIVHGTTPTTSTTMSAQGFNYSEPCVLSEPPLVGFADGNANFGGGNSVDFTWVRVGLTAVVVVNDLKADGGSHYLVDGVPVVGTVAGAGLAAFAPIPGPDGLGTCEDPAPLTAIVAGAGAAAGTPQ